jgi:diadenosine tetraphosphatase ApaH/serine/threonine PP2A family protein phosphatase
MSSKRTYAIGDIHGQFELLRQVHGWIEADRQRHGDDGVVVHVGDLVDRGPDSAGVLGWLIDGITGGKPWLALKGNHDRMMAYYLEDSARADPKLRPDYTWLHPRLGGSTTLASYGVDTESGDAPEVHAAARAAVPAAHTAFLRGLETVFQVDDVVFLHAGIRPGIALQDQIEDDLVWIREPFLSDTRDHGPLIVHGHTPIETVTHYGNRVNIDTGAAFGGPLSVIVVEGRETWHLTQDGRLPLAKAPGIAPDPT